MRRLFLFAFFMIVFLPFTQGQSIYSLQQDASWHFKYSSSRKADQYTNMVLKQLGLAHLKTAENTSFTLFFNYRVDVVFQQGSMLDLNLAIRPTICTGDVEVRDFDLQKILVPGYYSAKVAVIHPVNGEVYTTSIENQALEDILQGKSIAAFPDSLWIEGCRVSIEFKGFRFDEPSYKKIENELYAIRDYDAAATLADTLEQRIRKARVTRHTPQEAFRTFVFCSKGVCLLNEAFRTKTAIVPGKDPRGLLKKVPVIDFQFRDLTAYFLNSGINGALTGNVYLNQAQAFGYALSDALKLSQKVDYYSSPFYYRLYSNSTTTGQLASAAKLIGKYTESRSLRPVNSGLLSRRIVDEYIRQGEKLMAAGRYSEAVDMLAAASRFCSLNYTINTPLRLVETLAKARSGLIASYIRIVQKSLDNKLTTLADKYLSEAMQYADKYGITENELTGFAELYSRLANENIRVGSNLLNTSNYQQALMEFDKALQIGSQYNLPVIIQRADNGIQKAVHGIYLSMFEKAASTLKAGDAGNALLRLNEAREFASAYNAYRPDPVAIDSLRKKIAGVSFDTNLRFAESAKRDFKNEKAIEYLVEASKLKHEFKLPESAFYDSLIVKIGIPEINTLYSNGRLKLWAGEPENALQLAREAGLLTKNFDLNNNPLFISQHAGLMNLADELLCSHIKGELASLIHQAEMNFSQNKFDDATSLVLQARELIYTRAACGLNKLELNQLTDKYEHPVRWNEMVKNATSMIADGEFLKGIEMIQQAGALFGYYRLDSLGLVNTGLYELAIKSDHIPLVNYAVGYYIARSRYDEALHLLEWMRQIGVTSLETNELQESLARGLALRDVAETEMLNYKNMLKVYTKENKWYRRFADVYRFHAEKK